MRADRAMIERHELPEDAADWTGVVVDFPRLRDDTATSCPLSEHDVFDHVRVESADLENADKSRFRFVRTAQVKDRRFWLWEYVERDAVVTYVWVQASVAGDTLLCLNEANGLNAEQFILAAFYREVYWS
jgi:hypothetical protein